MRRPGIEPGSTAWKAEAQISPQRDPLHGAAIFEIEGSKIVFLRRPGIEPGSTAWKAVMLTIAATECPPNHLEPITPTNCPSLKPLHTFYNVILKHTLIPLAFLLTFRPSDEEESDHSRRQNDPTSPSDPHRGLSDTFGDGGRTEDSADRLKRKVANITRVEEEVDGIR